MGQRAGDLFDFICDEFKRDKNGVKLDKSSNKKDTFQSIIVQCGNFQKEKKKKVQTVLYIVSKIIIYEL